MKEKTIYIDNKFDIRCQQYCQRCENPIGMETDYKCPKCKTNHIFKVKDYKLDPKKNYTISDDNEMVETK